MSTTIINLLSYSNATWQECAWILISNYDFPKVTKMAPFEELWIGEFRECPFSLRGCQSYSFLLIFFIPIRFFVQFVWSYQIHKCYIWVYTFDDSLYVLKLMLTLSMITRELSNQTILTQRCIPYRIQPFDLHGK